VNISIGSKTKALLHGVRIKRYLDSTGSIQGSVSALEYTVTVSAVFTTAKEFLPSEYSY
jgi:hypothetical protein